VTTKAPSEQNTLILESPEAAGRLFDAVGGSVHLERLTGHLDQNNSAEVSGLVGAGRAAARGALAARTGRLVTWIVPDGDTFDNAQSELSTLLGSKLLSLPPRDSRPYHWTVPAAELLADRLRTLVQLADGPQAGSVLLVSFSAWFDATLPKAQLQRRCIRLSEGTSVSRDELIATLNSYGYLRADVVEEVGQYAVRGGIVDLFPTSQRRPLRVEYWGDDISSLRLFDVGSQRTQQMIEAAELWPQRESLADASDLEIWVSSLSDEARTYLDLHRDPAAEPPGLEWLFDALQVEGCSVQTYLPSDTILWLSDADSLEEREAAFHSELAEAYLQAKAYVEDVPEPARVVPDARPLLEQWETLTRVSDYTLGRNRGINFGMKAHPAVHGNLPLARQMCEEIPSAFVWGPSHGQLERLFDMMDEPERLQLCRGGLVEGFLYEDGGVVCFTEHELFARQPRPKVARRFREGVAISTYTALKSGDYVVHADYGVGQYRGLVTLEVSGRPCDVLELRYADNDKVYVPVESFNRVRKFSGVEGQPQLAKLGTGAWARLKARTKKKILEMAEELVKLYAQRKSRPGFAFGPDDTWMTQLEESFPYEETLDQHAAIVAIREDMESTAPMDRLVCGDVGFGKTEIAVRAAMKAICAGKQVAVLVPTTILAQQHLETFTERLAPFPVRVEMLSRFKSTAEQKEIVGEITKGKVDVAVGTHRLLSKDVVYRDLGLLVVDEEHRFGVRHKERIKQIKALVDCLTLTATPIPRTLQMSLLGARDLSVINTPPQGRLSVHTEIVPFSDDVIRKAVHREIDRGGQVFMVHNRVQSIASVYAHLKDLFPELDIVIAHGQMKESDLERVMLEFSHRKHQILLSTAIIESGLDIPLVNTILINRSDRFGLAQLYQLRGRVGRSKRQAYAYLLVPPAGTLTHQARRRLAAVEQHSDLGSGFHLAMRDLEIRGAGNLLGAQQHGFIEAVGYDLYTRLVEEAVAEVRGEAALEAPEVQFDTSRPLRLPEAFVPQAPLRVDLYQRLSDAREPEVVEHLRQEVQDRFGPLPEAASDLFDAAICRLVWGRLGVTRVHLQNGGARWEWGPDSQPDRAILERLAKAVLEPHRYSWGKTLVMTLEWGEQDPVGRFRKLLQDFWNGS
jgi:transcription-repair coupling factor (superfamily II helicase)